ncbi:MAG: DnaJ domain-containing protein [Prolixibacteraceae bacterium]|nr:DnaJ domain-containing protein [Prolixibacteraceae bacterium]
MNFKNYYSILGTFPHATQKEITDSYKTMAKKWHPDKNNGMDTTAQMQAISEAYGILKDKEKRKAYNIDYYKHYITNSQAQPRQEVKIEKCYYCKKNIANPKFARNVTFYKETKRSSFPQRKVWYQTLEIKIPRCEDCNNIHKSGSRIFVLLPLVSFSLLGTILGLTIWSMWFLCLIVGGIIGLILGSILSSIDDSIIAKEAGIKKESNIYEFEPVAIIKKEGWSTSKPEA